MCGICGCGHTETIGKFKPVTTNSVVRTANHNRHQHPDETRLVQVEKDILSKNNAYAAQNRRYFQEHSIFALNLVSSPGSGKTTLLVETIKHLKDQFPIAVIEGDQQTDLDAERIRATGVPAYQINTGRACHLDALGIAHAIQALDLKPGSLLFIENVGNLVCPAGFDLGEAHKVALLSSAEGEDKPLKYPDMFRAAGALVLCKSDLSPHTGFDAGLCLSHARRANPGLAAFTLSARTGEGLGGWLGWLAAGARQVV